MKLSLFVFFRIQLDKLISQGIDDRSWMIFDEHNRSGNSPRFLYICHYHLCIGPLINGLLRDYFCSAGLLEK